MKAIVIGPYLINNFGDDLIGLVIAKFLIDNGYSVSIPGITKENSDWLGLDYFDNRKKAIKGRDLIVLGGGGLLGDAGFSPSNRLQKLAFMAALYGFLNRSRVVVTGIGAGPLKLKSSRVLSKFICHLSSRVGVRDQESALFLDGLCPLDEKVYVGADIALRTDLIFQKKSIKTSRVAIQFDVDACNCSSELKSLSIDSIVENFSKHNIAIFSNSSKNSKIYHSFPSENIDSIDYSNMPDFLEEISKNKVILTSHLHLAIVSYSMGVPCFTIYVNNKTERFYRQIGHPERCIPLDAVDKVKLRNIFNDMENAEWTTRDQLILDSLKKKSSDLLDLLI